MLSSIYDAKMRLAAANITLTFILLSLLGEYSLMWHNLCRNIYKLLVLYNISRCVTFNLSDWLAARTCAVVVKKKLMVVLENRLHVLVYTSPFTGTPEPVRCSIAK